MSTAEIVNKLYASSEVKSAIFEIKGVEDTLNAYTSQLVELEAAIVRTRSLKAQTEIDLAALKDSLHALMMETAEN